LKAFGNAKKAVPILSHEAKALLKLFCLQPIMFGLRQNSYIRYFASGGKIDTAYKYMVLHWRMRTGSDWWFSELLQNRTGSTSRFSDQDSDWKFSQSTHLWIGLQFFWKLVFQDQIGLRIFFLFNCDYYNHIKSFR